MKKQKGYTLTELIIVIAIIVIGLFALAAIGGSIYIGWHFLAKVW